MHPRHLRYSGVPLKRPARPAAPTDDDTDLTPLRVIGVDPGLANLGFGIVEEVGREARYVAGEVVTTSSRTPQPERLLRLRHEFRSLLERHQPHVVAIEGQFFHHQRDVAFKVGQAVGVVLVTAAEAGLPVHEYGPMQVKQALVGTGRAGKDQVAFMVRALLKLQATPTNSHMADALAIALTHIQSRRILAHK